MHRILLVIAVLVTIGTSRAGADTPQPLLPPVQFERIGLEHGLPQVYILALAQDPRGFLWMGFASGGLARYDGIRWERFATDRDDPTTLPSQVVTALAIEPSGLVWVGTGDAGLAVYDPETNRFTRFRHDPKVAGSLSFDGIGRLLLDGSGTLWIGFGNGDVGRFDTVKRAFTRVVSGETSGGEITGMQLDPDGNLLVASKGGGVMMVQKGAATGGWLPQNASVPHDVTALLLDRAGTLWVGTESAGLHQLPRGAQTATVWLPKPGDRKSLSSEKITTLYEDTTQRLWVGTQAGLNEIDPKRQSITAYAKDANYPLATASYLKYVTSTFEDRAGIMWFGTLDLGLYKLAPLRRAFHSYVSELAAPTAFCDGRDGEVWTGTDGHGLHVYDFAKETYRALPTAGTADQPSNVKLAGAITSVHCTPDKIWIGGKQFGLASFQPSTSQYAHFPADPNGATGPPSAHVEHVVEGKDGALWLATWGGGLGRFEPATQKFSLVTNDPRVLPSKFLHRLAFDVGDPQVLWIGAARGGVTRLDLRTRASTVVRGPADGAEATATMLSSDTVLALYQEPSGKLWIGTDGGGLNSFDPKTNAIARFGAKEGLPSEVVHGILGDPEAKHLWLATNRGLVQFDLASSRMVTFTETDGLGSTELLRGGFHRSKSGEIYATTKIGFNRFQPKDVGPDRFAAPIVFTTFQIFDKDVRLARPIWQTPSVDVTHRDQVLTFEFAALSYAAPKQTRYEYMLEGFQDAWLTTDHGRVTFTNLDAGDYVLRIKAVNRHGLDTKPTELRIHVAPAWWRTKVAYGVYFGILALIGLLIVRWQRQRLKRVESEGRLALVEQELELTGAVQSRFLPEDNHISSGRVNVVGFYRPAASCSGDWWWHTVVHGTKHYVLVGDVTGHGAGPAMLTAAVATAFHTYERTTDHFDVKEMLEVLNLEVLRVGKGTFQMSLLVLELDEETGEWVVRNAGAPPIITLERDGNLKVHYCPGQMLGFDAVLEVGEKRGVLEPRGRILAYTDGIPEIEMPDGNLLGMYRFGKLFRETVDVPVTAAVSSITSFAQKTLVAHAQTDDWTFAIVEWQPESDSQTIASAA